MNKTSSTFFFIILLFFLFGCSITRSGQNVDEIKQNLLNVKYSDGITKQKAVYIAQNYLMENPPKDNPAKMDVNIYKVLDVYESDTFLNIQFAFIFENDKPFMYPFYWLVTVDKKTGEVLKSQFSGHK